MRDDSRVVNELYIKRGCSVLEDFLFFSLYSFSCIASNSTTLKNILDFLSLSLSLDTHFEFSPATSISPAPDPARYSGGGGGGGLVECRVT
jgi:hypothetical protein